MKLEVSKVEATVLWAILRNVGGSGPNRDAASSVLNRLEEALGVYGPDREACFPTATWRELQERIVPAKGGAHGEVKHRNEIYLG